MSASVTIPRRAVAAWVLAVALAAFGVGCDGDPTPADAGGSMDAGRVDAGALDAGPPATADAGVDAGPAATDAGPPDAGADGAMCAGREQSCSTENPCCFGFNCICSGGLNPMCACI